jgi:hypothetical protein
MVVTSTERLSNTKLVQPGNWEWVTVIQGVNAQGWTVPPSIIVSGKRELRTLDSSTFELPDRYLAV